MSTRIWAALGFSMVLASAPIQAQSESSGYSAAGLYNLANSYARAGKPGLAILNYERASLLAPGDPDVQANLRYVRASAHLPAETPGPFDPIAGIASPFWTAWIGVLGLIVAGTSVIAAELWPRYRAMRRFAALPGILLIGVTVCNAWIVWPRLHEGIVITTAAQVRVSPVPMGDPLFTLPEGEKVKIAAEHEGFALVETPLGRRGWIADSSLAAIVPR